MFRRAAGSATDQTEYLLGLWEDFERTQGTLESWNEFTRRAASCRLAAERRARKEEALRASEEAMGDENAMGNEINTNETNETNKATRKRDGTTTMAAKRACVTGESASQRKRSLREKKNDAATQRRTVFVTNVAFAATEEELRAVFADCGEVVAVTIVRNNHGKSRGFAYVEFAREEEAAAAVEKNGTRLLERKLEVKLSVPQEERKSEKKETPAAVAATIYVSGLAPGVSEYEFSVFFSKVRMGGGREV